MTQLHHFEAVSIAAENYRHEVVSEQQGHYFDPAPSSASKRGSVPLTLVDLNATLTVDRGVFSTERVDAGTRYLLMEAPRPTPEMRNVLDLGCGYGPIAIALALRTAQAVVWAVDVNERALELCRHNAEAAGVADRVRACHPDDLPTDITFDGIWSNPPIRVGKAALHSMLERWLTQLTRGAHAYLVVQRNLGSDSLQGWLQGLGWQADRLGSRAGYRILDVSKGAPLTRHHEVDVTMEGQTSDRQTS